MGGRRLSSDVRRDDESAASIFGRSSPPHSAGSSPSPQLLHGEAPARTRPATSRRRHAVIRIIRSPFAAVLRMTTCARFGTTSDGDQPRSNGDKVVGTERCREPRRRPSLEELLRMEASSSRRPEHKVSGTQDTASSDPYEVSCRWKESAIVVFGFADDARIDDEEEEEPLSRSKNHHVVVADDERRQTALVPVEPGGGAMLSPTAQMNVRRLILVLRALARALIRVDMGTSNTSYRKLIGSGGGVAGKAELFYYRPIPMGRRCRVQHLDESPYM